MIALHAKDRVGLLLGCGIVSLLGSAGGGQHRCHHIAPAEQGTAAPIRELRRIEPGRVPVWNRIAPEHLSSGSPRAGEQETDDDHAKGRPESNATNVTEMDLIHEHRDRMRRNWRASISRACRCGSAARPRSRGDALHFRKGNRRARALRPVQFPIPKTADDWSAFAFFAGDSRVPAPFQRKPFALPWRSTGNSNRTSFWGWVVSPPPRRCWPERCAAFRLSFTNRMRFPERRTGSRREWCARFCLDSRNARLFFRRCARKLPVRRSGRSSSASIEKSRGNDSVCGKICSRSWSWAEARARAESIRR